jgi:hypothetical protein
MPTTLPDLRLCDGQTATGAGLGVVGFGESLRYADGVGLNQNRYPHKFEVHAALKDSTTGATATLTIEDSPDGSTWTALGTMTLSLVSGSQLFFSRKGFSTKKIWIRGNVTALAGGSAPKVDAYATVGSWGA